MAVSNKPGENGSEATVETPLTGASSGTFANPAAAENATIVIDAHAPGGVVLPSGDFATSAQFTQQGDDLIMIG
ncbi:MAG: hypothetical protein JKY20_01570, partial [Alphaproteobacteria bacterium]|nr:hypothetical protein [Alphaproteobacteria bacterium]